MGLLPQERRGHHAPQNGTSPTGSAQRTQRAPPAGSTGAAMKTWRETESPEVKGKREPGEHASRQMAGCAVSDSEAKGGTVSGSRGRGRDSGSTAQREQKPPGNSMPTAGRAQGRDAQLLDRRRGAEDCGHRCPNPGDGRATWSPPGRPQERWRKETTCRKPPEATRNKDTGPEANGAQRDGGKETQAGTGGGQPGWRAREPGRLSQGDAADRILRGPCRSAGGPSTRVEQAPVPSKKAQRMGGQKDSWRAASHRRRALCPRQGRPASRFPAGERPLESGKPHEQWVSGMPERRSEGGRPTRSPHGADTGLVREAPQQRIRGVPSVRHTK